MVLPVLILFGYFYIKNNEGVELLTSEFETIARPGQEGKQLGAKTKAALAELNSINFDESIFSDPSFLSLQDFTEEINTSPLQRDYPFSTPDELRTMVRRNSVKTNLSTPDYSSMLNSITEKKK